uniref:Snail n=1 Tax=Schmidtea polychroa TaxID=50054 RepID=D3J1K4_SCHPL|nr:snail [Schmidtea polychroa]
MWNPINYYKLMQQKQFMQTLIENNLEVFKQNQSVESFLPRTPSLLDQSIAYPYIWLSFWNLCKKYEDRLLDPVQNIKPDLQDTQPFNLSSAPISPVSSTYSSSIYSDKSINSRKLNKTKPFSCVQCGKRYCNENGLKRHQAQKCTGSSLNDSITSTETNNSSSSDTRQYSCRQCNKVYFSLSALKMHVRTHTLPCKCTICGKAFSRMWLLTGHMRTHTGEKPFSCSECDRAFADRSNLRAHMQTHSQVKRYQCDLCHKTFSRMGLLTKHKSSCLLSH